MGKISVLFAVIFVGNFSIGQTTFNYQKDFITILKKTQNTKDPLSCSTLRTRFLSNDKSMTDYEVLALLIGYTAHKQYKPYDDFAEQREIYSLNVAGKFQEAVAINRVFLIKHPYNIRGHIEMAFSFQGMNNIDSSEVYAYRAQRIQNAMLFSGDGKTKSSAMFSLSSADGRDFILTFLKAGVGTKGSSTDDDGNFLDVFQVKYSLEKAEYYYFNIQHASKTVFGGKSLERGEEESVNRK